MTLFILPHGEEVNAMDIEWSLAEDTRKADVWRVEGIGPDGECYVALFSGPDAKERAEDYYMALVGDEYAQ